MALQYHKGSLILGDSDQCAILPIAEKYERPFYLYHLGEMLDRVRALQKACTKLSIHYAMKANSHPLILKAFQQEGIGVDVVSQGEIKTALQAGFSGKDIIFSGVAKTKSEIEFAIRNEIKQINVESLQELSRVAEVSRSLNKKTPVAFRFNPDVDAGTHPYIATGLWNNKFGMDQTAVPELIQILKKNLDAVNLVGISIHIGSQIADFAPLEDAILKTIPLFHELRREGFSITTFDVGGGVGVNYETADTTPSVDFARIQKYGELIERTLGKLNVSILCEPGRILVGRSGVLVGRVEYTKKNAKKNFLICNTGVHHFMRPALYSAYHRIIPAAENHREKQIYDVVGPICESSDVLGKDRELPQMLPGESIVVADTGAYGMVMANHYNQHELPLELIWQNGKLIS